MLSTVTLICEPLSCQPIAYTKEKYKHLADLDLADFFRVGDDQLAKRRLQGLFKWLRHHPEVLQEYNAIIQEQLMLGIVEKVSDDSSEARDDIHHLPLHALILTDKQTTKIRIVYDASARDKGISLNDCLLSGPKFEQNILDIFLRFRTYRIALIADVEKAFLMIAVSKDDRNSIRFWWIDDVEKPQPELQQMRFTRVVFGVSASPFLLNATITHHLDMYHNNHPELVNTLKRSIYVDDVTYGANQDDDLYHVQESVC